MYNLRWLINLKEFALLIGINLIVIAIIISLEAYQEFKKIENDEELHRQKITLSIEESLIKTHELMLFLHNRIANADNKKPLETVLRDFAHEINDLSISFEIYNKDEKITALGKRFIKEEEKAPINFNISKDAAIIKEGSRIEFIKLHRFGDFTYTKGIISYENLKNASEFNALTFYFEFPPGVTSFKSFDFMDQKIYVAFKNKAISLSDLIKFKNLLYFLLMYFLILISFILFSLVKNKKILNELKEMSINLTDMKNKALTLELEKADFKEKLAKFKSASLCRYNFLKVVIKERHKNILNAIKVNFLVNLNTSPLEINNRDQFEKIFYKIKNDLNSPEANFENKSPIQEVIEETINLFCYELHTHKIKVDCKVATEKIFYSHPHFLKILMAYSLDRHINKTYEVRIIKIDLIETAKEINILVQDNGYPLANSQQTSSFFDNVVREIISDIELKKYVNKHISFKAGEEGWNITELKLAKTESLKSEHKKIINLFK